MLSKEYYKGFKCGYDFYGLIGVKYDAEEKKALKNQLTHTIVVLINSLENEEPWFLLLRYCGYF